MTLFAFGVVLCVPFYANAECQSGHSTQSNPFPMNATDLYASDYTYTYNYIDDSRFNDKFGNCCIKSNVRAGACNKSSYCVSTLERGTWQADFATYKVQGKAYCLAQEPSSTFETVDSVDTDAKGKNCWCQVNGYMPYAGGWVTPAKRLDAKYVSTSKSYNSELECVYSCPAFCGDSVARPLISSKIDEQPKNFREESYKSLDGCTEDEFIIRYVVDGETVSTTQRYHTADATIKLKSPSDFRITKENHEFVGWNVDEWYCTKANCAPTVKDTISNTWTGDKVLYAKWKKTECASGETDTGTTDADGNKICETACNAWERKQEDPFSAKRNKNCPTFYMAIGGNYNYSTTDASWWTEYNHGSVGIWKTYGHGYCSDTPPQLIEYKLQGCSSRGVLPRVPTADTIDTTNANHSNFCWCRIDDYQDMHVVNYGTASAHAEWGAKQPVDAKYVFVTKIKNPYRGCAADCALYCASNIQLSGGSYGYPVYYNRSVGVSNEGLRATLLDSVKSCTPNEYPITYIINGVEDASLTPATYKPGLDTVTLPTPDLGEGIEFIGWCDDEENCAMEDVLTGTITTGANTRWTDKKVLYAKWKKHESKIKYSYVIAEAPTRAAPKSRSVPEPVLFYTQTVEYGSPVTLLSSGPTNVSGHRVASIKGNYNTATAEEEQTDYTLGQYIESYEIDGDLEITETLEAETYDVDYSCGNGTTAKSGAETKSSFIHGKEYSLKTVAEVCDTNKGYDDSDCLWNCTDNVSTSGTWTTSNDVTCVAQCEPIEYTIQYNNIENVTWPDNQTPIQTYTVESADIIIPKPERAGYTFDAWCDSDDASANCVNYKTIPTGSTGDITLYATWVENDCPNGKYLQNSECISCPDGFVNSDNSGCYATCTAENLAQNCPQNADCVYASNIQNARDYYNSESPVEPCAIISTCKENYHKENDSCVLDYNHIKYFVDDTEITDLMPAGTPKIHTYGTQTTLPDALPASANEQNKSFRGWYTEQDERVETIAADEIKEAGQVYKVYAKLGKYTITYYDDDSLLNSEEYITGDTIVLPTPERKANKIFAGWCVGTKNCSDADSVMGGTIVTSAEDGWVGDKVLYEHWTDDKFQLVTTSNTKLFGFGTTSAGVFFVDWGDGVVEKINNSNTNFDAFNHHYNREKSYVMRLGGVATEHSTNNSDPYKDTAIIFADLRQYPNWTWYGSNIQSVSGSLGAVFPTIGNGGTLSTQPRFSYTFSVALMDSIPETLFDGIHGVAVEDMFSSTFVGSSITSIPSRLFSNITTNEDATGVFSDTFGFCEKLTEVPEDLFSSITTPSSLMFRGLFYGCSGLRSIPANLFNHVEGGAPGMFESAFYGCSSLTEIPATLFSKVTKPANFMFAATFENCTGLREIPATLFSNIRGSTADYDTQYMFSSTFEGCTSLTLIPKNLFDGITGSPKMVMFYSTFYKCSNIEGFVDNNGIITKYIPADYMSNMTGPYNANLYAMTNMLKDTKILDECPGGYEVYDSTFSPDWSPKVSCIECTDEECASSNKTYFYSNATKYGSMTFARGSSKRFSITPPSVARTSFQGRCVTTDLQNCDEDQYIDETSPDWTSDVNVMDVNLITSCEDGEYLQTEIFDDQENLVQPRTCSACPAKFSHSDGSTASQSTDCYATCPANPNNATTCPAHASCVYDNQFVDENNRDHYVYDEENNSEHEPCGTTFTCNTGFEKNANETACVAMVYYINYYDDDELLTDLVPNQHEYGTATILPTLVPDYRPYYNLEGWYKTPDFQGNKVNGISATTTPESGDTFNFYGKWVPRTYSIYFKNKDTNQAVANSQSYTYGVGATLENIVPTPTTVPDHYEFDSWCTDAELTDCSETINISNTDTGDKVFFVKLIQTSCNDWEDESYDGNVLVCNAKTFTLSYKDIDGSAINSFDNEHYTYTARQTKNLPTLSGEDFVFIGWCDEETDPNCNNILTETQINWMGNKELTAKVNLTSCGNGDYLENGQCKSCSEKFPDSDAQGCYAVCPELNTLPECQIDGINCHYDVYVSNNRDYYGIGNHEPCTVIQGCENDNKYMKIGNECRPRRFSITYIDIIDDEEVDITESQNLRSAYTFGEGLSSLPTPQKQHYVFNGWKNGTGSNAQTVTSISNEDYGDKTLYATWTPKTYTLSFVSNTNTNYTPKTYTIEDWRSTLANLPPLPQAPGGYTSSGWFDNPNYTGAQIRSFSANNVGIETLYANLSYNHCDVGYTTQQNGVLNPYYNSDDYIVRLAFVPLSNNIAQSRINTTALPLIRKDDAHRGKWGISLPPEDVAVYGEASCNSTSGKTTSNAMKYSEASAEDMTTSDQGTNCWCRMLQYGDKEEPTPANNTKWIYVQTMDSKVTCATSCPQACADTMANEFAFRSQVFGDYSVCSLTEYNVDYELNNYGSWCDPESLESGQECEYEPVEKYTKFSKTFSIPKLYPTDEYHTFGGWCDNPQLTGNCPENPTIQGGSTGHKTFYAKWMPKTYNIHYVLNPENIEGLDVTGITPNPSGYTIDGYVDLPDLNVGGFWFMGWYADFDENEDPAFSNRITGFSGSDYKDVENDTLTVYAKWEPAAYAIRYFDGTSLEYALSPSTYGLNPSGALPEPPSQEHYNFVGWCVDAIECTKSQAVRNFDSSWAKNIDLYAKWEPKTYPVRYTCGKITINGETRSLLKPNVETHGYDENGNPIVQSDEEITYNEGYDINAIQERETNSENSKCYAIPGFEFEWDCPCRDYFDPESGDEGGGGGTVSPTHCPEGQTCQPKDPIWADSSASCIGHWKATSYNVNYNLNDSALSRATNDVNNPTKYDANSDITLLDATRNHYSFDKWNWIKTSSSREPITKLAIKTLDWEYIFTRLFADPNEYNWYVSTLGDKNLSAEWIPDQYNIKYYHFDNGSLQLLSGLTPDTHTFGTATTLPTTSTENFPSKPHYDFVGWYKDPYFNGSSYTSIPAGDDQPKGYEYEFYGNWVLHPYKVNYLETDGKEITGLEPSTYTYGFSGTVPLTQPEKEHFQFLGWCVGANNQNCANYEDYLNGYPISADSGVDITLYARWEKTSCFDWEDAVYAADGVTWTGCTPKILNIRYFNGDDNITDSVPSQYRTYVAHEVSALPSIVSSLPGYEFDGWCDGVGTCSNHLMQTQDNWETDKRLFAQWKQRNYTVSFAAGDSNNDGTGIAATGTTPSLNNNHVGDSVTLPQNGFTAPDGYVFTGWKCSDNADIRTASSSFIMTAEDITCTAQWAPVTYRCDSGYWLHVGSNAKACLDATKKTNPAMAFKVPNKSKPYYLQMTADKPDLILNTEHAPTTKLRIQRDSTIYNVHDDSVSAN